MPWVDITSNTYWDPGDEFGTDHFVYSSSEWQYNLPTPPTGPHTARLNWVPAAYTGDDFTHVRITLRINNDKVGSPDLSVYITDSVSVDINIGEPSGLVTHEFDLGSAYPSINSIRVPINYGFADYEYFDFTTIEVFAVPSIPPEFWDDEATDFYTEIYRTT